MKGVKDLLQEKRFQTKHVREMLVSTGIPGRWDNYQNIYNLIEGRVKPQDPIIYLMFSEMLDKSVVSIMERYSNFDLSEYAKEKEEPSAEEKEGINFNQVHNW